MGFRKRNANKSDNRSKAKVVMGKPASQLTKEDKKILSARIAEIKSANGGKTTVQNTIPYMCMYKDGVCQVSENFFSMTVQFKYTGRKPLPTDWTRFGQLYGEWRAKNITGRDFMRRMDMSANTFYRRVREYELRHGITEQTSA